MKRVAGVVETAEGVEVGFSCPRRRVHSSSDGGGRSVPVVVMEPCREMGMGMVRVRAKLKVGVGVKVRRCAV
jgi:hypothetical protein